MKNLKKFSIVIIAIFILLTLTGCTKTDIKINSDGSAKISFQRNYKKEDIKSNELFKMFNMDLEELKTDGTFEEIVKDTEEKGYKIEQTEDDKNIGYIASKQIDNITEFNVTDILEEQYIKYNENIDETKIKFEKTFFTTKIEQDITITMPSITQEESVYKIQLPYKTSENTATNVSDNGKILEWNIKPGEETRIYFKSVSINILPVVIFAGIILLIIVILIIPKKPKSLNEIKKEEIGKSKPVKKAKKEDTKGNEVKKTIKKEDDKTTKKAKPKSTK